VFKVDYDDKKSLEKPATKEFVAHWRPGRAHQNLIDKHLVPPKGLIT
jgi:hypothetical protein